MSLEITKIDYRVTDSDIPIYLLVAGDGFYSEAPQEVAQYIKEFKQANPKTEVYIIEEGQHFLPMTNTEDVANLLWKYIKSK